MTLKLQVGKKYRNAKGEVCGPLEITKRYPDRFTDEMGNWYGEDGHFWQQDQFCPFRLVEEVPESAPMTLRHRTPEDIQNEFEGKAVGR